MYHIGFCGDENYIKYIAAAMYSIVKNTDRTKSYGDRLAWLENGAGRAEEKYCFHLITDWLSEATKDKLLGLEKALNGIFPCSLEIHYIQNGMFENFPKWRGNYAAYYRIVYPRILPETVKYFLYLDGDILVLSDIREIFCEDLEGCAVGAVVQYRLTTRKLQKEIIPAKRKDGRPYSFFSHKYYFCSGVMLFDLEEWKKQAPEDKIIYFLNTYQVKYPDQDALNFAFKDNFKVLDFKYDMYMGGVDAGYVNDAVRQLKKYGVVLEEYREPCIVHYMVKPWNTEGISFTNSTVVYNEYIPVWWRYAEETPCFAEDLKAVRQSENFRNLVQRNEKRKRRYEKYAAFYFCRKWFSLWKERFLYWLNGMK